MALLELSREEISSGQTPRAIVHLTPLLKFNMAPPQEAEIQWLWGIASMQEGEYAQAETALEKSVKMAPDNSSYHESLGDLWATEGNFSKADTELSKAYSLSPQNTLIKVKRDWIALNLQKGKIDPKKIQAVVKEASQFRKDHSTDQTSAMIEARGDTMLGKPDEALKVFDSVLAINPNNAQAILGKSGILLSQKHVNQARQLMEKLLTDHPNNIPANLMLAGIDIQTNNIQDEASRLETVNHERPHWVKPALALSIADLSLGRFSQAKSLLTEITQSNPKILIAKYYLARADMGLNNYQDAIDTLKPLLLKSKESSAILSLLGDASLHLGQKEEAISYWKKALKTAPKSPLILNNLAFLLSEDTKELPQAIIYAKSALAITKQPFIEDTLGYLLYLSGHFHQAQEQFDAAKKTGFKNAEFQYHMGLNEWRLGNTKLASDILKEAIIDGSLTSTEKKKAHEAIDQMASK
jgi:tetratricopeptide (TPR) repeat protein